MRPIAVALLIVTLCDAYKVTTRSGGNQFSSDVAGLARHHSHYRSTAARIQTARQHTRMQATDVVTENAEKVGNIVTVSPAALSQLEALKKQSMATQLFIRFGVRAGGCNGFSYVMDVMQEEDVAEKDTIETVADGIQYVIDPKSLMLLYGLQLDYSNAMIGGGFQFSNPNAAGTCGCGNSFGV